MNTNIQSCSPLCKTTVLLSILKKKKERERRGSATQRGLIQASVSALLFFFIFFCLSTVHMSGGRDWLYCPPRQRGQAVKTELITMTATPEKKKKTQSMAASWDRLTFPHSNLHKHAAAGAMHGRNTAHDGPKCGRKEGRK